MRRALALAAPMVGRTGANPAVGCVLVKDGVVIAEAATAAGGALHAEQQALAQASAAARGATAFVTLEPCAQRSAGGESCSDLLLKAGIARVVIAARDPHPLAGGVGLSRLRAAGVDVVEGVLADEAAAQNADFFARLA